MIDANGHETRASDSSLYDEICTKCGATDARDDNGLNRLCPQKVEIKLDYMEIRKDNCGVDLIYGEQRFKYERHEVKRLAEELQTVISMWDAEDGKFPICPFCKAQPAQAEGSTAKIYWITHEPGCLLKNLFGRIQDNQIDKWKKRG